MSISRKIRYLNYYWDMSSKFCENNENLSKVYDWFLKITSSFDSFMIFSGCDWIPRTDFLVAIVFKTRWIDLFGILNFWKFLVFYFCLTAQKGVRLYSFDYLLLRGVMPSFLRVILFSNQIRSAWYSRSFLFTLGKNSCLHAILWNENQVSSQIMRENNLFSCLFFHVQGERSKTVRERVRKIRL